MNVRISTLAAFRTILDRSGFTFVDNLNNEERKELGRLGYNMYHFAPFVDIKGKAVVQTVAAAPNKTYLEAQDWIWEALGLDSKAEGAIRQIKIQSIFVDVPESYSFDQTNDNFTGNNEHDMYFIVVYQNVFNDKLKAQGYVFLNDVLSSLGFKKNQAGQLMGWTEGDKVVIETLHEDNAIILKFPTARYIFDVLKEN